MPFSLSEFFKNWLQVIALLAAGTWVLYEFVLTEERRGHRIGMQVEVIPGAPIRSDRVDKLVTPLTLNLDVTNTGDQRGHVLLAMIVIHGHTFGPRDGLIGGFFRPSEDDHIVSSADLDWAQTSKELAFAFVLSDEYLDIGQTLVTRPILPLADAGEFDIFTYEVVVWAAESCHGLFPFQTCSVFSLEVLNEPFETCSGEQVWHGICARVYRADERDFDYRQTSFGEIEQVNAAKVWATDGFFTLDR